MIKKIAGAVVLLVALLVSVISPDLASAQGIPIQGPGSNAYCYSTYLTIGSSGNDVTALQKFLYSKGYFPSDFVTTGYFGESTRTALAKFQVVKGISPAEGDFGPQTMKVVNGETCPNQSTSPAINVDTAVLKTIDSDDGVRAVALYDITIKGGAEDIYVPAWNSGAININVQMNGVGASLPNDTERYISSNSGIEKVDIDGATYYKISANGSYQAEVSLSFRVDHVFAGDYKASLLSLVGYNLGLDRKIEAVANPNTTNNLVIAGETSAYITSINPNPVAAGKPILIKGDRITEKDWVVLIGKKKIPVKSTNGELAVSTKGIKAGSYHVQIYPKGKTNQKSNLVWLTIGGKKSDTITIFNPNGGEILREGDLYTINWNNLYSTPSGSDIELVVSIFNGPKAEIIYPNKTLAVLPAGTNSYTWKVERNIGWGIGKVPFLTKVARFFGFKKAEADSNQYVISVNAYDQARNISYGYDVTDKTFTIEPSTGVPSLNVTYPNGGEELLLGSGKDIDFRSNWTSSNLKGDVNIYLNSADGFTCFIGTASVSDGTFGKQLGSNYLCPNIGRNITDGKWKVYIESIASDIKAVGDYSDEYFTIKNANATPSIKVQSPNGGEQLVQGQRHSNKYSITWSMFKVSRITAYLAPANSTGNMVRPLGVIGAVDSKYSSMGWDGMTVWTSLENGKEINVPPGNYKIYLVGKTDSGGSINDLSDNTFTILAGGAPVVTVSSPNGGEELRTGVTNTIAVLVSNFRENQTKFSIELIRSDGMTMAGFGNFNGEELGINNTKAIVLANASYSGIEWIPSTNIPAGKYKIRVGLCADGSATACWNADTNSLANDWSDNYFTITAQNTYAPIITHVAGKAAENGEIDAGGSVGIQGSNLDMGGKETWIYIGGKQCVINQFGKNLIYCTAPSDLAVGQTYDLYINAIGPGGDKVSSNIFKVKVLSAIKPSITVTSQNEKEAFSVGDKIDITWSINNFNAKEVQIVLYGTDTKSTQFVKTVPNTGIYSHILTENNRTYLGNNIKSRVIALGQGKDANKSVEDFSDGYFTINSATRIEPEITLISTEESTQVEDGANNDTGAFSIRVRISSKNQDVYIGSSSNLDAKIERNGTTLNPTSGVSFVTTVAGGVYTITPSGNIKIPAGEFADITVVGNATLSASGITNGFYKMSINKFTWGDTESNLNSNSKNIYYSTNPVNLNRKSSNSASTLESIGNYLKGIINKFK